MKAIGYRIFAAAVAVYNGALILAVIFFVPKTSWDMTQQNQVIGAMAGASALLLVIVLLLGKRLSEQSRMQVFVSTGLAAIVAFRWLLMVLMW